MDNTDTLPTAENLEKARAEGARRRAERGEADPFSGMFVDPGAPADSPVPEHGMEAYPVAADEPDFAEESSGQIHLVVEGKHEKLNTTVEGRTPTSSSMRITGGKVEVAGQYQPGDRVSFLVTVVVDEVVFKDERDAKTGQVVGRARNHKGYVAGIHEE